MGDIFYTINVEKSKCSKCGKSIKNVYEYNGNKYGYYCFMKEIGMPIEKEKSKEKPLPSWLIQLVHDYIDYKVKNNKVEERADDFEVNFWNEAYKFKYILTYPSTGGVYHSSIKLNDKRVPVYWQYQICNYLQMRWKQITK